MTAAAVSAARVTCGGANPYIAQSPLIAVLRSLHLPSADFAVFGSGPMLPAGLRQPRDLDLVARGAAWHTAARIGVPATPRSGLGRCMILAGGLIEVFDAYPHDRDPSQLIDGAAVIDGIRWVQLHEVLVWKRRAGRTKDVTDCAVIERYLTSLCNQRQAA